MFTKSVTKRIFKSGSRLCKLTETVKHVKSKCYQSHILLVHTSAAHLLIVWSDCPCTTLTYTKHQHIPSLMIQQVPLLCLFYIITQLH